MPKQYEEFFLLEGGEDAADEQEAGGDLVEEFEAPVVDGDLLQLQEDADGLAESPQDLSTHGCSWGRVWKNTDYMYIFQGKQQLYHNLFLGFIATMPC